MVLTFSAISHLWRTIARAFGVIDVSEPSNPVEIGFWDTDGYARDVMVLGQFAFVADGDEGLRVIDVSVPVAPTEVGFWKPQGIDARNVTVSGDLAFVGDFWEGVWVIDISNPAFPVEIGVLDTPGYSRNSSVSGNQVFVADNAAGLAVLEIDACSTIEPIFMDDFESGGTTAWSVVSP